MRGPIGRPAASAARVTTKKPGYLLLVGIDANGNMSQIFPSPEMIVQSQEAAANFIKPGEELLIPNSAAKKRGSEYVMTSPTGGGGASRNSQRPASSNSRLARQYAEAANRSRDHRLSHRMDERVAGTRSQHRQTAAEQLVI